MAFEGVFLFFLFSFSFPGCRIALLESGTASKRFVGGFFLRDIFMCPFGLSPMIFTILLCLCSMNLLFYLAYRLDAMGSVDPKPNKIIKPIITACRDILKRRKF